MNTILEKELILPCGVKLKNRIAKSAMSENMSPINHRPNESIIQVYQRWAIGGAGLIITGNIMVDNRAIAEPGNVLIEDKSDFEILKRWASVVKNTEAHLWAQINHPGRQAIGAINKHVVAPSAIKSNIKGMGAMFKKPKSLTELEIPDIIERFGNTAQILKEAGFTGIQIHGAHGYLISQFLSPLTNLRKDQWGGNLNNRTRFLIEVYKNIRSKVGNSFPIGVKINSADFQRGGFTEEESMEVVQLLDKEGIDLIEVSGGNYEQPAMTGIDKKTSTKEREAYFFDYVEKIRELIKTPLMLTGGFRTISTMEESIIDDKLDVIGIARPFTLIPNLPNLIFDNKTKTIEIPTPRTGIKLLDNSGFVDIKWHEIHIHRLAKGKKPNPRISPFSVIIYALSLTLKNILFGKRKKTTPNNR